MFCSVLLHLVLFLGGVIDMWDGSVGSGVLPQRSQQGVDAPFYQFFEDHFLTTCLGQIPGSLRCVAQNPRIQKMMNLIQRIHCSYACASFFSLPFYFPIVTRCTAHCHFNCVQVQTLPTEQAAPVLTDSFSRDYNPYTHACKARPLTTVGRTSLSAIIIITWEDSARDLVEKF